MAAFPEKDEMIEAMLDDLADSIPVPQSYRDRDIAAWCFAEAERRDVEAKLAVQRAVKDVMKPYLGSSTQGTPTNKVLVDLVCERIPDFARMDLATKKSVYEIAVHDIGKHRLQDLHQTSTSHANREIRKAAAKEAQRLEKLDRCRDRLAKIDAKLAVVYTLSVDAGRELDMVAEMCGLTITAARHAVGNATVEIDLLLSTSA